MGMRNAVRCGRCGACATWTGRRRTPRECLRAFTESPRVVLPCRTPPTRCLPFAPRSPAPLPPLAALPCVRAYVRALLQLAKSSKKALAGAGEGGGGSGKSRKSEFSRSTKVFAKLQEHADGATAAVAATTTVPRAAAHLKL